MQSAGSITIARLKAGPLIKHSGLELAASGLLTVHEFQDDISADVENASDYDALLVKSEEEIVPTDGVHAKIVGTVGNARSTLGVRTYECEHVTDARFVSQDLFRTELSQCIEQDLIEIILSNW